MSILRQIAAMRTRFVTRLAIAALFVAIAAVAIAQDGVTRRDSTLTETRQFELSQSDIERARAWSLTETEWHRYRELLRGIRGSVSPATLSPIEVLGIHARDDAERRQYAERWAAAMFEDAERILKFQRAYDDAAARLYPGQMLVDPAVLHGGESQATDLRSTDRMLLRLALDCPSCDAVLGKALARLDDVAGLDIYVTGATQLQEQSIRDWARAQGIQADWVRKKRVTLNIGDSTASGRDDSEPPPTLYIKRGESIVRLAYAVL